MRDNVLITGITGQVGSQLADYILENTVLNVVGMMRWQEPLDNIYHLTNRINNKDRVFLYYADLNDGMSITKMIEDVRPDYISHLAAQSYPKTSFDIPIETLHTNILGRTQIHYYQLEKEDEGKMVIFPSNLRHQVYPFYNCDEERISVSGNILVNTSKRL